MRNFAQDLKQALRSLARNPGFTAAAIAALALGIGANTAIFSLVNGILLKPLPFKNSDQLVMVWLRNPAAASPRSAVSPLDFLAFREQAASFSALAAMRSQDFHYIQGDEPVRFRGHVVSWNFFDLLGVKPILGHGFRPAQETPGAHRVVLLTHSAWRTYFGGDPGILGKTLLLNKEPFVVTGVLPPQVEEFRRAQIYAPMAFLPEELSTRNARYLYVLGRLKPGADRRAADRELEAISARLAEQFPETNRGWTAHTVGLLDNEVADIRPALLILSVAVLAVLVIACTNASSLMLVRAAKRGKEMAIRCAVGAGPGRLFSQMVAEGAILAAAGAAVGAGLAHWALKFLIAGAPPGIPRLAGCRLDATVLLYMLALAGLVAALCALAPLMYVLRADLQSSLRESARGLSSSPRRSLLRNLMVVCEVAFCTVLLVGSGLLARSFATLIRLDPGFRPSNLLVVSMALSDEKYFDDETCTRFVEEAIRRTEHLPGIQSVAAGTALPMMRIAWQAQFEIPGRAAEAGERIRMAAYTAVTPGYFRTLGIPLFEGRDFTARDRQGAPSVVIISRTFARRYFPGEDPVGQRIRLMVSRYEYDAEIVGVVGDAKQVQLEEEDRPMIYQPHAQCPWPYLAFAFRTAPPPMTLAKAVRAKFLELEPGQAVDRVETMEGIMQSALAQRRMALYIMGVFGVLSVVLAAFGIYAVIAYSVSQRTQEFGVRIALGADRGRVLGMVMREGLWLAAAGLVSGCLASLGAMRLLAGHLYGVAHSDPITYASAALIISGLTATACAGPALRACSIDPLRALRAE